MSKTKVQTNENQPKQSGTQAPPPPVKTNLNQPKQSGTQAPPPPKPSAKPKK